METIVVSLPKNENTLKFKCQFNEEERNKIIEIGINLYETMAKKQACWDDERIQQILKNEKEKYLNEINNKERACETRIQQSVKMINEDKKRLEKMICEEKDKMRDYYLNRECEIRAQYEVMLSTERTKYESTFVHTQNSTILGQDGENFTYCELNKSFPSAEIEDCRKQSGRGDFIMTDGDFVMMIECKNYKKNVLKPEVEKFYRDVDKNNDIKCAVLVSLKSGICAKPDFHFEVRDGKPILFLHKVSESIENLVLAVRFFKLMMESSMDLSGKEVRGKIKNIVQPIKRYFRSQKKLLDKFKVSMEENILNMEEQIKFLFGLIEFKY